MDFISPMWSLLADAAPKVGEVAEEVRSTGWKAIEEGHGIQLTIVGMLVVFSGLIIISLAIMALPKFLELLDRSSNAKAVKLAPHQPAIEPPTSDELMVALAYVFHKEMEEREQEDQRITIPIGPTQATTWSLSSKMRTMPRSNAS